jgi:hypothetical protein
MIDTIASSELTRSRLAWKPTHRGLIADLAAGLVPMLDKPLAFEAPGINRTHRYVGT